jgi:hypothetical protein
MLHNIADQEWFELQFEPELAAQRGIAIPGFPGDHHQVSFTGMSGRQNLEQAFSFYKYARKAANLDEVNNPHILDFGVGWGRIARFWLRDTRPENITASDTMDLAVSLLRELKAPYDVVKNPPFPPGDYKHKYDLVYAFSVFSHLSEKYTIAWIDHLIEQLEPNGRLVLTTRGNDFIRDISYIKGQTEEFIEAQIVGGAGEYLRQLRRTFPDPAILRERYDAGEFQFFQLTDGRLPDECTGETIIPRAFFEQRYGEHLLGFDQDVEYVNQAVVTLRR